MPETNHPLPATTWQKELAHTLFSVSFSVVLFLPVAMLVSLFISWLFSLMSLYSWLTQQPEIYFWVIFTTLTLVGIGSIMLWLDKQVETKVLQRLPNDQVALITSVITLIVFSIAIYFIISWFVNFLNVNFWLN